MNGFNRSSLAHQQQYQPIVGYQSLPPKNDPAEGKVNVGEYVRALKENWWLIAAIVLAVMLIGTIYTFIVTPKYEANILVQVDESVAQPKNLLTDLSSVFERKGGAATEMEVLRSRNVLSRAVEQSRAYIDAQPRHAPFIGSLIANIRQNWSFRPAGNGGRSGISVGMFNVPEAWEGRRFTLTPEGNGQFRVQQPDLGIDFKGKVNEPLKVATPRGEIALRVDQMKADPGAEFTLTRNPQLDAVDDLQKSIKIVEKGKQSGVIGVSLVGTDPVKVSSIVNEIGREYIRQTVDHKAEEAEKSLEFLNKQLPVIKQELENAEVKYNQIRNAHGTVDLGEESKAIVQQSSALQTKLVDLRQKKDELHSKFEDLHPAVQSVNAQINDITQEINAVNARIKGLPAIEQEVLRAARDVKVNTELYTNLLSTAQQLRQVSASRLGGARLLDTAAVPIRPVGPSRAAVISFSALLGLMLGVAAAIAKKKMRGEVSDPFTVESSIGVPVSATIPHSPHQKSLYARLRSKNKNKEISVLPYVAPEDDAVEGLRGFRTVLQYGMADCENNIIVITGPAPSVGKSFVSANIANVVASIDKKVLLIDGDMRTGYLHRYFGLERGVGLSELITGQSPVELALHRGVVKNVDFISTGTLPDTPADLLASKNFTALLHSLAAHYDFVLIDTAPVLAFTDAMVIAPHAGAIYNVVRDGISTVSEIEETVRRLTQAGGKVTGTIFNDMKGRAAYRYGY
jgi:tyrosine-protein kinase Etk/Wzc